MAAAAVRGAVAGILGRWAPWAARCPATGRALSGLAARGVGQVRAPTAAPLWKPRLLPGNPPGGGDTSILSSVTALLPSLLQQPARTLTYCSLRKGKRKTVKAVTERFLRLHNGLWVRRQSGYKKKLWKKSASQKKRLRELVLCTRTQCKLLDKMTTSFWKRRNWYVDDPYQKYHDRTNLHL
ncbi:large ribosomal subunit protein bL35m [Patagioenas fasciata]|uniref:Large ribosomal subunit protein bL35m n=1 Tax=Patagioenas fasciata monilis TaxID=372326 RepID=A0A1V4JFH8_PATFA|nr:39S ribosomal protein L35, mitochondrial [Patagioenas fasciata monilis]